MSTPAMVVLIMIVVNAVFLAAILVLQGRLAVYIMRGTVRSDARNGTSRDVYLDTDDGEVFPVILDENGSGLAAAMSGKRVVVRGKLRKIDGRKHLAIEEWEEYVPPWNTPKEEEENSGVNTPMLRPPSAAA